MTHTVPLPDLTPQRSTSHTTLAQVEQMKATDSDTQEEFGSESESESESEQ